MLDKAVTEQTRSSATAKRAFISS